MFMNDESFFLTTGFLNVEDVAYPGGLAGLAGVPGDLGKICAINRVFALQYSKTSIGTLYAGLYQKVQFLAGTTAANIRGGALFWTDRANFVVSPDATSALEGDFAGVGLMINTKGNYGFIQVAGKASVLFRATVTDKTNGNIVLQLTTTRTFDALAESTGTYISGGTKGIKNIVGTCLEAPTDGGTNLISLRPNNLNIR